MIYFLILIIANAFIGLQSHYCTDFCAVIYRHNALKGGVDNGSDEDQLSNDSSELITMMVKGVMFVFFFYLINCKLFSYLIFIFYLYFVFTIFFNL